MAKKSLINKQQKKQKYSTREYTRCSICGRPHAVLKNMEFAEFVLEILLTKVKSLVLKRQVGKRREKE